MKNAFCVKLVENQSSVSSSALAIRRNVNVFLIIESLTVTKDIINFNINAYKRLLQMQMRSKGKLQKIQRGP